MNIPQSAIEPFGYTGMPTLDKTWTFVSIITDAVHNMASDPRFAHMSPMMMGILIRESALRAGAHSARAGRKTTEGGGVIFKVSFTLRPNEPEWFAYPCFYHKR
jgi:hypothetical protein